MRTNLFAQLCFIALLWNLVRLFFYVTRLNQNVFFDICRKQFVLVCAAWFAVWAENIFFSFAAFYLHLKIVQFVTNYLFLSIVKKALIGCAFREKILCFPETLR